VVAPGEGRTHHTIPTDADDHGNAGQEDFGAFPPCYVGSGTDPAADCAIRYGEVMQEPAEYGIVGFALECRFWYHGHVDSESMSRRTADVHRS
jgi:hypothetical protein